MPTLERDPGEGLAFTIGRVPNFNEVLLKVKSVPGARFNGEDKTWVFPDDPGIAERILFSLNPDCDDSIIQWAKDARKQQAQELTTPLPDDAKLLVPWAHEKLDYMPDDFDFKGLFPYQRAFVEHAVQQLRLILADDMGLGKTIQALTAVKEHEIKVGGDPQPRLIICPASVKGVWSREIRRLFGEDEPQVNVDKAKASDREAQLQEGIDANAWNIVNYEQIRAVKVKIELRNGGTKQVVQMKQPLFESTPWGAILGDEIHRAKNRNSQTAKGLHRLQAPFMLGMTGTPLQNSPDELWSILRWLFPKEYTSYWRFYTMYVDYYEAFFGNKKTKIITGVRNPDALRFELRDRLVRRTKDEVLDLPEKIRDFIPVELGSKQRKLYKETETAFFLAVEQAMKDGDPSAKRLAEALANGEQVYRIENGAARTVRLRQVLSSPGLLGGPDESAKLDACMDMITDNDHKQHVVFTEFVGTVELLVERLRAKGLTAEGYTGDVSTSDRTELQDSFQRGDISVLVGTIGAMREGITLTSADTVHFIERAWTPGWNEQAEDRLHRVGQTNKVTIYIYEAVNSVDDNKITPTNRLKESIVSTVIVKDTIKEKHHG